MPNALRDSIDAFAKTFASSIVDAIKAASLDEILSLAAPEAPVRRGPGRPRGKAATSPKPLASKNSRDTADAASPAKATSTKKLATVTAITTYVTEHPGQTGETIRKALGVERAPWSAAVAHCIDAKLLRREGEKRSTRYWVA